MLLLWLSVAQEWNAISAWGSFSTIIFDHTKFIGKNQKVMYQMYLLIAHADMITSLLEEK